MKVWVGDVVDASARALMTLLFALLISACASSTENSDEPGTSPDDARSGPSSTSQLVESEYFVEADSTAVNRALRAASNAITAARGPEAEACNEIGDSEGFGPWRNCLHDVLDPVVATLAHLTSTLSEVSNDALTPKCQARLEEAGSFYDKHAAKVNALLRGFNSENPAAQNRSAVDYRLVISTAGDNLGAPLVGVTQACFSPEALESLSTSSSVS